METIDLKDFEILAALRKDACVSSEDFFSRIPNILQGGEPAKAFALRLRLLLQNHLVETKLCDKGVRYWRLSKKGIIVIEKHARV